MVTAMGDVRLHFLDWGGPSGRSPRGADRPVPPEDDADGSNPVQPGVLLLPGLLQPAWSWSPVARRLSGARHTVVADLRGQGLSDAPTGRLRRRDARGGRRCRGRRRRAARRRTGCRRRSRVRWRGRGRGRRPARAAMRRRGPGGWRLGASRGDHRGRRRRLPARLSTSRPRSCASMDAYLADRRAFDPETWDGDQERAARDAVVETAAGHVLRAVRPHVIDALVRAMFDHDPAAVLAGCRGAGGRAHGAGRRRCCRAFRRAPARRCSSGSRGPRTDPRARASRGPQPDALPAGRGDRRDPWGRGLKAGSGQFGRSRRAGAAPTSISAPARPRYHRRTMTEPPDPRDLPDNVRRIVDEIEHEIGDDTADADGTARRDAGIRTAGSRPPCARSCSRSARTPSARASLARRTAMHRMYHELTAGYHVDPERLINGAIFDVDYCEMVVVKDIPFYSLCEHHLLPFFGTAARRLHARRAGHRAVQDPAGRRDVRPPAPGPGADDPAGRRLPDGAPRARRASAWCSRRPTCAR